LRTTGVPHAIDTNPDNHPRLESGHTNQKHTVYMKPVTARHMASTSRDSEEDLGKITSQEGS
jgi:hypothetical protein